MFGLFPKKFFNLKTGYYKKIQIFGDCQPLLKKFGLDHMAPLFVTGIKHGPKFTQINKSLFELSFIGNKKSEDSVLCELKDIETLLQRINEENDMQQMDRYKKEYQKLSKSELLSKAAKLKLELEKARIKNWDNEE
ncbi:hypothetical protein MHBO_001828 [Bonamia ostreae]|uniref:LAGLIDADG homing endonuclease n=1 Tax=Bonamia ostreae TaxID=126728 RepID=A0ABV2AKG1_9EUKA